MSVATLPVSPFKGLTPFDDTEVDALLFFGRTRETEVIAANVQAARLTVLYGPSGVGKSSVLRAGVAHRLRADPDTAVEIIDAWSGDAVAAVEAAVGSVPAGVDLYLILDQFEEYFVYDAREETLPRLLADVIGDRGLRVNVLIGIRDDALALLDTFRSPVPNLLSNRLRLDRLDREAAEAAVVGPIQRYNELAGTAVSIEPQLVEAVLDEVAAGRVEIAQTGRGAIGRATEDDRIEAPYLQLVLERLWQAERGVGSDRLRLTTLRSLGGSARIVRDHLERAMASLSPDEQQAAAQMYHHLVTPSGTKIAHRVGDLAGYASVAEHDAAAILGKLARERILRASSDDGPAATRYEIYHDVLADAVLAWRVRHEEQIALRSAHSARRRARVVAAAALIGLVVVGAIAVYALVERSHSRVDAKRARAGELVAQARAALDTNPPQGIAAALSAARLRASAQAEDVLRDALLASHLRAVFVAPTPVVTSVGATGAAVGDGRGLVRALRGVDRSAITEKHRGTGAVTSIAASRDGRVVAGLADGNVVGATAAKLHSAVTAIAVDGDVLAAGAANGEVVIQVRRRRRSLQVRGRVTSLAVSPSGRTVLVTSHDRRARVVDVRTGRVLHTLTQRGFVNAAAFSPDGRVVVTGSQDRTGVIWDARTGRPLHTLRGATGGLTAVAFSPDGSLVGVASADAVARVYDVATGAIRFYLSGDTNSITDIAFNPAGTALVTASADGTARIWTSDIGRQLAVLRGHTDAVTRAFFTGDGRRVVTAGADGTVRVWDPGTEPELRILLKGRAPFVTAQRRKNGTIAVTDATGLTRVLDPRGQRVVATSHTLPPRIDGVSAQHGSLLATADGGVVTVTRGGNALGRLVADADALEFSPDGRLLAVAGRDRYLRVWDVLARRLQYAVIAHQGPVRDVSFSPDGRWIVTAGPISAGVWRASNGSQILLLRGPTQPLRAALFTGDGATIVAAGMDRTIRTYPCAVCGTLSQLVRVGERLLARSRPR